MANKAVRFHADVILAMSLDTCDYSMDPDDKLYDGRLLAEGDACFTMGAIPSSNRLFELRLKKSTRVLNRRYPGDIILAAPIGTGKKAAHPVDADHLETVREGVWRVTGRSSRCAIPTAAPTRASPSSCIPATTQFRVPYRRRFWSCRSPDPGDSFKPDTGTTL